MSLSDHQYLKRILLAPVYDVAVESDLNAMPKLSRQLGNQIYLKREDQQVVKSFKLRGAYNKMVQLTAMQRAAGVVAASAGNHAQGVAYCANKLQINAVIVMPDTTPQIKIDAVREFGGDYAKVQLHGSTFDQANQHAKHLAVEQGLVLIPPFDDQEVIIGQGTIGKELLAQCPQLDYLFVAVGGGGLAAGLCVYLKQLRPELKIIAVEAKGSACFAAARAAGQPVTLDKVNIFADGVAVKTMGEETFRLCQQYIDDCVEVSNDEICAAIQDIFDDTRVIAEPAGALSVAAIRKYAQAHNLQGKHVGGILCGANINFHTLRYVSERCELGEQKEAVLAVTIPEQQGAFKTFCEVLGGRTITEFNYRYADQQQAQIFVGVSLKRGLEELAEITQALDKQGYIWLDMTGNEMAKLHVRYMVGGRPAGLANERLYSFAFPEHPGALLEFLTTLGQSANISLFHYRNHGAAEGLVLAGFEVEAAHQQAFNQHLDALGYRYHEQSDNPAYQMFLRSAG